MSRIKFFRWNRATQFWKLWDFNEKSQHGFNMAPTRCQHGAKHGFLAGQRIFLAGHDFLAFQQVVSVGFWDFFRFSFQLAREKISGISVGVWDFQVFQLTPRSFQFAREKNQDFWLSFRIFRFFSWHQGHFSLPANKIRIFSWHLGFSGFSVDTKVISVRPRKKIRIFSWLLGFFSDFQLACRLFQLTFAIS